MIKKMTGPRFVLGQRPARILSLGYRWTLAATCLLFFQSTLSSDDPYLSELDAEVDKVESRALSGDGQVVDDVAGRLAGDPDDAEVSAARQQFETLLQEKYVGTYRFYQRLPERGQQEIFLEFRDGLPLDQIREKIVDRLLQR